MPAYRCHSLLSVAVAAGAIACGSDNPAGVPTRALEITVVTSGEEADSDGYTVQIDAEGSRPVGLSQVLLHREISPGVHTIYLGGVADNCRVEGANPRTVNVPEEGTTAITIQVLCAARPGNLLVVVRTRGVVPYPSPYSIAIDGSEAAAVDTGRVLVKVPPGRRLVQLQGVPEHCTVQGNPISVTVRAVEVTPVEFLVLCASGHGILEISTSPLGYQNPGDFAFRVDGGTLRPLPSSATLSMEVTAGDHTVEIFQIPPNCRVLGPNPHPIDIPAGGRARVNFTVHCDPFAPGSLAVSVTTSGSVPDPDGYQVLLNGDTQYPLRPTDRVVIDGLSPGHHLIALLGVSANCRVEGEQGRTPFVPVGGVAEEEYVITCSSPE